MAGDHDWQAGIEGCPGELITPVGMDDIRLFQFYRSSKGTTFQPEKIQHTTVATAVATKAIASKRRETGTKSRASGNAHIILPGFQTWLSGKCRDFVAHGQECLYQRHQQRRAAHFSGGQLTSRIQ